MFYDDELRACADVALRESLCHWSGLKRKGFPVIFEAVWGNDEREENSPSFFNPQEVSVVVRYVKQLKEARGIPLETDEIGIISPYHKQVSYLSMVNLMTLPECCFSLTLPNTACFFCCKLEGLKME